MTDPMTRIADALELLALTTWMDSSCNHDVGGALFDRIEARHSAQQTPGDEVASGGDSGRLSPPIASEPQTMDVLGSELRVGDIVVAVIDVNPTGFRPLGPWTVDARWTRNPRAFVSRGKGEYESSEYVFGVDTTYRVRLPRPAAEPSAKTKCPTCRCMIAPGSQCACCESMSGDDPPLPDLDLDDAEPSASGEGIASTRPHSPNLHLLGDERAWFVGDFGEPVALTAAINAAHVYATRELRARCERAESNALEHLRKRSLAEQIALGAKRDRDAAIARAEAAERVVRAAKQIGSVTWSTAPAAMRVIDDALDAYDAARKDDAK